MKNLIHFLQLFGFSCLTLQNLFIITSNYLFVFSWIPVRDRFISSLRTSIIFIYFALSFFNLIFSIIILFSNDGVFRPRWGSELGSTAIVLQPGCCWLCFYADFLKPGFVVIMVLGVDFWIFLCWTDILFWVTISSLDFHKVWYLCAARFLCLFSWCVNREFQLVLKTG